MAGLPDAKIDIVRNLVEHAPDKVVTGLQNALAAAAGDTALAGVRRGGEAEGADRNLRNRVLEPIAPLFAGDAADQARIAFPRAALALIWRGLKAQAPFEVASAARALVEYRPGASSTEPFDILTQMAADGLRAGEQRDFIAAIDAIEPTRPGGTQHLLSCLTLAPIVRQATLRLPEWIGRFDEEHAAAARVAYKDAGLEAEDAGPRFFEMLSAQLAEPWTILRVVSAVMDRPNQHYLPIPSWRSSRSG